MVDLRHSAVLQFPVQADLSEELRGILLRLESLELDQHRHEEKLLAIEDWRAGIAESVGIVVSHTAKFPDAFNSLGRAVSALTGAVDAQRRESVDWHTEIGRGYLDVLSAVAEMRKEATDGARALSQHKKNEGALVRGVVILSGVLIMPITAGIVTGWDSQIRPALEHVAQSLLGR